LLIKPLDEVGIPPRRSSLNRAFEPLPLVTKYQKRKALAIGNSPLKNSAV
jgi:hypothetical protein